MTLDIPLLSFWTFSSSCFYAPLKLTTKDVPAIVLHASIPGSAFTTVTTLYDVYASDANITRGIIFRLAAWTVIHSILFNGKTMAIHLKGGRSVWRIFEVFVHNEWVLVFRRKTFYHFDLDLKYSAGGFTQASCVFNAHTFLLTCNLLLPVFHKGWDTINL